MTHTTHTKMSVAVDFLLFTIEDMHLKLLMVRRGTEPFQNLLALPGVAVSKDESLTDAAYRCLKEETGITDSIYMEQLYTWGDDCNRDPRDRVISISYIALIPREQIKDHIGERVTEVGFFDVDELLAPKSMLAFDHKKIVAYGRERLRSKAEYSDIAFHLIPDTFTLPNLQTVYEILLGKPLFKANFRKRMANYVDETGEFYREQACRPSRLYRRRDA